MAPGRKKGANKAKAKGLLSLGDLVLAKVKGFPAWPAKVSRPEDWDRAPDPKKYFVQFFGTQEIAFVAPPDIQAFNNEAKNKLLARCQGKTVRYFAQAVTEICVAFEELQSHKPNAFGNEVGGAVSSHEAFSADAVEADVTKAGTDRREARKDGTTGSESKVEPCFRKLDGNNDEEVKPVLLHNVKGNTTPVLDSKNRTALSNSEALEHGSSDPISGDDLIIKNEAFDHKTDGVDGTEHPGSGLKDLANGQRMKKIAGGSDRSDDAIHREKSKNSRVPDARADSGVSFSDPNRKLKDSGAKRSKGLLKDKASPKISVDKHDFVPDPKSVISSKKKKLESEQGKPIAGVDENSHASKKPRFDDVKDPNNFKIKPLLPAVEDKVEELDCKGAISDVKREIVLGLSAQRGSTRFGKEVVAYTKRRRPASEHAGASSVSGSRDKGGKGCPEQKDRVSSFSSTKVPVAQLPRKRRAVRIFDEDDDEDPKTPVHGGNASVPKVPLVSTHGSKNADECRDTSIKARQCTGSSGLESTEPKESPLRKRSKTASPVPPACTENLTNSSPIGKPVPELPSKDVKQILKSPKNSPQPVLANKQVAGQNKAARSSAKVSAAGTPKKAHCGSSKDTGVGSDNLSASQSQTAGQRHKLTSSAERLKVTPKAALRLNHTGVSRETYVDMSGGTFEASQENRSFTMINTRIPDSATPMKDLIAAAQAKRKQAHSQNSIFVNLNPSFHSITDAQTRSHSPFVGQNVTSSVGNESSSDAPGHQQHSSPSNQGRHSTLQDEVGTEENEERRVSSGHRTVGGSLSGGTEAAVSRDAFEGMIETLSRTKESIGRATRLAIDCAKYGIASEVVELLIRKLESEPSFHRKVDLFFLVDSITQCSHNQKGIAGASYIPTVQAALPRLLGAAVPPGTGARENRRQCLKVLKLWLERKIFSDSLLRRYIDDIGASGDDATVGFSLRRPSRAERAVDDPIREMEGMLVDEYGSNASFQLPGIFSSCAFEDDEEDEDLPSTCQKAEDESTVEPVHALGELETQMATPSDKRNCILEDVDGELEMEDVSGHPKDARPSSVPEIETKEQPLDFREPAAANAAELLLENSPPLPHESPPSPPPLPPSPPPPSPPPPPSSPSPPPPPPPPPMPPPPLPPPPPAQLPPPPPPPPSLPPPPPPPPPSHSLVPPPSLMPQPSMASHPPLPLQPGFPPPAYPLPQQPFQASMQREHCSMPSSNQAIQMPASVSHGSHVDGPAKTEFFRQQSPCFAPAGVCSSREPSSFSSSRQLEYGNNDMYFNPEASLQNQRFQPSNAPFAQRPMVRNLPQTPSSHFPFPGPAVQTQPQHSYPHPYPFPSQPDEGRRYVNEEPWRMPSGGNSADNQSGAWISGRNPHSGPPMLVDGFFRPPTERPPSGSMGYQLSAANNLQGGPPIPGHAAPQMLPSRPDMPPVNCWRPA